MGVPFWARSRLECVPPAVTGAPCFLHGHRHLLNCGPQWPADDADTSQRPAPGDLAQQGDQASRVEGPAHAEDRGHRQPGVPRAPQPLAHSCARGTAEVVRDEPGDPAMPGAQLSGVRSSRTTAQAVTTNPRKRPRIETRDRHADGRVRTVTPMAVPPPQPADPSSDHSHGPYGNGHEGRTYRGRKTLIRGRGSRQSGSPVLRALGARRERIPGAGPHRNLPVDESLPRCEVTRVQHVRVTPASRA